MSRPSNSGGQIARWIGLALLVLALPLFVRATAIQARTGNAPDASPATGTQNEPPTPPPTLTPQAAAPTTVPLLSGVDDDPVPVIPVNPDEVETGIMFSDGTPGDMPSSETIAPQTTLASPAPPAAPTPEPGVWTHESDRITVRIERHQQDDFTYFAADIQLTDPSQLTYAFSNEKYGAHTEALSDIAARHDPLVAINGDYYSFHNNGIIIRGGEVFRKNKSARHLLAVESNGDLTVMTDRSGKQGVVANQLVERGVLHTFEFGPVLVENGEPVRLNSAILRVGEGYLEPRTAIGQLGPLHYLVIVVDGRSDGYSVGCDLPTLQQLFVDYGVQTAFNLDGGGSTTLWFDGRVINQPSSGDERKVSDIVMFMR